MVKTAIVGAGGFGREVRAMLEEIEFKQFVGFIDDNSMLNTLSSLSEAEDIFISIADPSVRKSISTRSVFQEFAFANLIHPSVYVHSTNSIGKGCIICAGTKITTGVFLADFVIINLNSVIGHDVRIGSYCSIMPSVNLLGGVQLGEGVFVGAGATILQNLSVGEGAIIGAGSVVTKSVPAYTKVMGVPAQPKNQS